MIPVRVSCRDNPDQLARCLRSIRDQMPGAQVLVRDDCSNKENAEAIGILCFQYDARILRNPTPVGWDGRPASKILIPQWLDLRNLCLASGTDYALKMDSDAVVVAPIPQDLNVKGQGGTISGPEPDMATYYRAIGAPAGMDETHVQGGAYVLSLAFTEAALSWSACGALQKVDAREDQMTTAIVRMLGYPVSDLPWIDSRWKAGTWERRAASLYHPIKNQDDYRTLEEKYADE